MTEFNWKILTDAVSEAENILVLPHVNADGDSVSSAFAVLLWLKTLGKNAVAVFEEEIEERLKFIIPTDLTFFVLPEKPDTVFDVVITVDSSTKDRLGTRTELFDIAPLSFKIDHHQIVDSFAKVNFENPKWAANCEGMWEFFNTDECGFKNFPEDIKKRIAMYLYVGILMDTGSFAYANVTENTLKVASELMPYIDNNAELHFRLFDATTKKEIALKGLAYSKLEYGPEGKSVFLNLTQEDFDSVGAVYDDANDIISAMRTIGGVEVAAFARPNRIRPGIKVSLRTSNNYDAGEFASSRGGGGHRNAAGFEFSGSFEEAKEIIIKWME